MQHSFSTKSQSFIREALISNSWHAYVCFKSTLLNKPIKLRIYLRFLKWKKNCITSSKALWIITKMITRITFQPFAIFILNMFISYALFLVQKTKDWFFFFNFLKKIILILKIIWKYCAININILFNASFSVEIPLTKSSVGNVFLI